MKQAEIEKMKKAVELEKLKKKEEVEKAKAKKKEDAENEKKRKQEEKQKLEDEINKEKNRLQLEKEKLEMEKAKIKALKKDNKKIKILNATIAKLKSPKDGERKRSRSITDYMKRFKSHKKLTYEKEDPNKKKKEEEIKKKNTKKESKAKNKQYPKEIEETRWKWYLKNKKIASGIVRCNKEGKLVTSWGEGRWLVNEDGILVLIWNGKEHKMTIGKNRITSIREYGIKIV